MRADLGLLWNFGFQDRETLFVAAMWDDAQLRADEVAGAANVFVRALGWLTEPENWECKLVIAGCCGQKRVVVIELSDDQVIDLHCSAVLLSDSTNLAIIRIVSSSHKDIRAATFIEWN